MASNQFEELLRQGIAAARMGNNDTARRLLTQALQMNSRSELAWMWMATVSETSQDRLRCLNRVLDINPNNRRAREAVQKLRSTQAETPRPTAAPPRQTTSGFRLNRRMLRRVLLGGVAVAIVGIIGLAAINLSGNTATEPPPTTSGVALVVSATPEPTLAPTNTLVPNFVIVTERTIPDLPATFTPTPTPDVTSTPTPTFTPTPLDDYTLIIEEHPQNRAENTVRLVRTGAGSSSLLLEDVRDVRYSPGGEFITFTRPVSADGAPPVYEVFAGPVNDLNAVRQVTDLRTRSAYTPTISPDGSEIIFVSNSGSNDDLYLLNVADGTIVQLTSNAGHNRQPVYSPDGRRVAFVSDRGSPGQLDIYTLTFTTTSFVIEQLTDSPGSSYAPAWTPDGQTVVHLNDRRGTGDIYAIDVDGERIRLIYERLNSEEFSPTVSPDGFYIFFVSNLLDDRFDVYRVGIDGSHPTRITNDQTAALSVGVLPPASS